MVVYLNSPLSLHPTMLNSTTIRRPLHFLCFHLPSYIQHSTRNIISIPALIMAASKSYSTLLPLLSIFVILLALTGKASAGHNVPKHNGEDDEKKEPQFFFGHDGSFHIPGFERVVKSYKFFHHRHPHTAPSTSGSTGLGAAPPAGSYVPTAPSPSGSTGLGAAPPGRSYIPGGDDTFVIKPGQP